MTPDALGAFVGGFVALFLINLLARKGDIEKIFDKSTKEKLEKANIAVSAHTSSPSIPIPIPVPVTAPAPALTEINQTLANLMFRGLQDTIERHERAILKLQEQMEHFLSGSATGDKS